MTNPLDTKKTTGTTASDADATRPDTSGEKQPPPKAGSEAAKDEERKTQPSRNRGVADV